MKTIIRHDDTRIIGRDQSRLTDRAWWSEVARQPQERVAVVTRSDGTFDYAEIDTPDAVAIETLNHVLSGLAS